MNSGISFLQAQVSAAVANHAALVQSLSDHEVDAIDPRYRDLCARHLPHMLDHQRALEGIDEQLGSPRKVSEVTTAVRRLADTAVHVARELADLPRSDDYTRLTADLALARQCEDNFKVFRDAGRTLRIGSLARLGEVAERDHDDFAADAGRLLQQMFVESARGTVRTERSVSAIAEPDSLGG